MLTLETQFSRVIKVNKRTGTNHRKIPSPPPLPTPETPHVNNDSKNATRKNSVDTETNERFSGQPVPSLKLRLTGAGTPVNYRIERLITRVERAVIISQLTPRRYPLLPPSFLISLSSISSPPSGPSWSSSSVVSAKRWAPSLSGTPLSWPV